MSTLNNESRYETKHEEIFIATNEKLAMEIKTILVGIPIGKIDEILNKAKAIIYTQLVE